MPKCIYCGTFVFAHPEAIRERPEVFRGSCPENLGGHVYGPLAEKTNPPGLIAGGGTRDPGDTDEKPQE